MGRVCLCLIDHVVLCSDRLHPLVVVAGACVLSTLHRSLVGVTQWCCPSAMMGLTGVELGQCVTAWRRAASQNLGGLRAFSTREQCGKLMDRVALRLFSATASTRRCEVSALGWPCPFSTLRATVRVHSEQCACPVCSAVCPGYWLVSLSTVSSDRPLVSRLGERLPVAPL